MCQELGEPRHLGVAGELLRHIVARYSEEIAAPSLAYRGGNIGNEIYEHFILSFDYGRGTVLFDWVHSGRQRQSIVRGRNQRIQKSSDALTVVSVRQGPAGEVGMRRGT